MFPNGSVDNVGTEVTEKICCMHTLTSIKLPDWSTTSAQLDMMRTTFPHLSELQVMMDISPWNVGRHLRNISRSWPELGILHIVLQDAVFKDSFDHAKIHNNVFHDQQDTEIIFTYDKKSRKDQASMTKNWTCVFSGGDRSVELCWHGRDNLNEPNVCRAMQHMECTKVKFTNKHSRAALDISAFAGTGNVTRLDIDSMGPILVGKAVSVCRHKRQANSIHSNAFVCIFQNLPFRSQVSHYSSRFSKLNALKIDSPTVADAIKKLYVCRKIKELHLALKYDLWLPAEDQRINSRSITKALKNFRKLRSLHTNLAVSRLYDTGRLFDKCRQLEHVTATRTIHGQKFPYEDFHIPDDEEESDSWSDSFSESVSDGEGQREPVSYHEQERD